MKKCCIFIGSEFVGLYLSIGKLLQEKFNYDVSYITNDRLTKGLIHKIIGKSNVVILNEINLPVLNNIDIFSEAERIENLYGKTMSIIMSEDRALGRGYIFNATAAPFVKRSIWSHRKKISQKLNEILRKEIICKDCDLVLKVNSDSIIKMILDKNKGIILNLLSIKFGDRIFWCDDPYLSGTNLKKNIYNLLNDNTKNYVDHIEKPIDYKIDSRSNEKNVTAKYTFFYTIKRVLMTIINELKVTVRRNRKKDSYIMFGWIPVILRNFFNYNYVKKIGVVPHVLSGYRIVYFPLHLEPEIALLSRSPEFTNSMEAIAWISKSLPARTILVCKEQNLAFGVRPKSFYKQINMIGNIYFSHPSVSSWDWIKYCNIVSTITGTSGIEAVHFKKPVISFSKHYAINLLPSVRYANNYDSTKEAIDEMLNTKKYNDDLLSISKKALSTAQLVSSFDFPEYKNIVKSQKLYIELADKALEKMFIDFPSLNN
jgi:hypothetical protein